MKISHSFFKRIAGFAYLTLIIFALASATARAAGETDASFAPAIGRAGLGSSTVSSAVQPDGKILIAGAYEVFENKIQPGLIRLNPDGTIDQSFQANVTGTVDLYPIIWDMELQPDGKILIAGRDFTVDGAVRKSIVRLNQNGSLDTGFNAGDAANDDVTVIAVQPDGRIVVGGYFTVFDGVARNKFARINADGTFDPFFEPGTGLGGSNVTVEALLVQADGKIVIGGSFQSYNGISRNGLVRVNPDGSVDTTFAPLPGSSGVYSVVQQADGKFIVGGIFTQFNSVARPGITRLNSNGLTDNTFAPTAGGNIYSVATQADGKTLAIRYNEGLTRYNADGTLDTGFNAGTTVTGFGKIISFQPSGEIFTLSFTGAVKSVRLVRFGQSGAVNDLKDYFVGVNGATNEILRQPDGKIIVVGHYDSVNGFVRGKIVRLNADGTTDASFNPSAVNAGILRAVARQADGKYLVGGDNISVNGNSGYNIVRLNADGSIDSSFAPGTVQNTEAVGTQRINTIAVAQDGKIYIGGVFTGYNASVNRLSLARLNQDGTLDSGFTKGVSVSAPPNVPKSVILRIMIQPDGKIVVSGNIFFGNNGDFRASIERFNPNNTVDATFQAQPCAVGPFCYRWGFDLQPDGKINLGDRRLLSNGQYDPTYTFSDLQGEYYVFAVKVLPDGKVLVGGGSPGEGTPVGARLVRRNADGSLDSTFNTTFSQGTESYYHYVDTLALQPDGKVLVGGIFNRVNGVPRTGIARLNGATAASRTKFDFDGDGKSDISVFRPSNGAWYVQQSSSGFAGVQFGLGTDKLVPADYDGDGKTDVAVYRGGTWYLQRSSLGFTGFAFGDANDIPQPADFDGDGKADLAVWRPSNGVWYVYNLANNQFNAVQFGASGDKPTVGDFDGDGKADYAVFRAGTWYLQRSNLGFTGVAFGEATDKTVAADYDGDGKTDVAVFRPSNGTWYLLRSQLGFTSVQFGASTDLPVPADYDGDGKTDFAVFRPANGTWYLQQSLSGFTGAAFGASDDRPVPNAFVF